MASVEKTKGQQRAVHKQYGELARNEGIDEPLQQWIREEYGVQTVSDVAKLSAEEVNARIKETGMEASAGDIERFIANARKIVAEERKAQRRTTKRKVAGTRTSTHLGAKKAPLKVRARGVASKKKTRKKATTKPIVPRVTAKGRRKALSAEPRLESHPVVFVDVGEIRAYQPDEARYAQVLYSAERSTPGYLNRNEPVAFEVIFDVRGAGLVELAREAAQYDVRLSAHSYRTHGDTNIGTTAPSPLLEAQSTYIARLHTPKLALDAGQFRLEVIITVRNLGQSGGGCSAALIQII